MSDRFTPGTFAPDPDRAPTLSIVASQARIESLLFLRHGEQQLLSMIIPLGVLIGLSLLPFVDMDDPVTKVFPMSLSIALMSAGFTGQAIAVAFDRRYGALKRIGASGVPKWALISGKIVAVLSVVAVQVVVLSITALLLGWRPNAVGILFAICIGVIGVGAFTSLGLLLGGTLSSELVLALGNTLWFVLMGAAAYVTMSNELSDTARNALMAIPSVALMEGLGDAFTHGNFNVLAAVILLAWGCVGTALAMRTFSFTMDSD